MKTKTLKILTVLATILLVTAMCASTVFAVTPNQITVKDDSAVNGVNDITNIGQNVLTLINAVAIVIAVVILVVLGIKYMMGSAEEKADYKKSMIPYLVGAVLIFAASTITGIVYDMANALNGGE